MKYLLHLPNGSTLGFETEEDAICYAKCSGVELPEIQYIGTKNNGTYTFTELQRR